MNDAVIAKDLEHLNILVHDAIESHGLKCNLNHIDVSNILDMSALFKNTQFDGDISLWNVSSVVCMNQIFSNSNFNGDISKWDTSRVQNMRWMFSNSSFNGDISAWNTSSVKDMYAAFSRSIFNGDLSKWDVSQVETMAAMFVHSKFRGDIGLWNVTNVKQMRRMFQSSCFDGDLSMWQPKERDYYDAYDTMFDFDRMSALSKPLFYHWYAAFKDVHVMNDWPKDWQTHFQAFSPIVCSLSIQEIEAACTIQHYWNERNSPILTLQLPELSYE